jgi:hypothetical protein
MSAPIDKTLLKESLKELTILEPNFVKELIKELANDLVINRKNLLDQIINEDFEEYGEVFKALA